LGRSADRAASVVETAACADEQSPEDRARYEFAEQEARAKKAGLWRDGTAVPPWEWRALRPKAGE